MIEVSTCAGRRSCRCPYCDGTVWIRRDGCLYVHGCVGDGRRVAEPLPRKGSGS